MNKSKVLSERELAIELGLSPWTVRNWRLQLDLPHFRTKGRVFYRLETVLEWISKQEQKSNKDFSNEHGILRKVK